MIKNLLKISFGLLMTQSALALDVTRFDKAVSKNELFINFDKDMVLNRYKDGNFVHKRFEQTLEVKKADGPIQQMIVRCDITQNTKSKTVKLATTKKSGKWTITRVDKLGNSIQRWSLSRNKQTIDMTCVALEKNKENTEIATISPTLIDQALKANKSTIEEKTQVATDVRLAE